MGFKPRVSLDAKALEDRVIECDGERIAVRDLFESAGRRNSHRSVPNVSARIARDGRGRRPVARDRPGPDRSWLDRLRDRSGLSEPWWLPGPRVARGAALVYPWQGCGEWHILLNAFRMSAGTWDFAVATRPVIGIRCV